MEKIVIEGKEFEGWKISSESANILMIKAEHGFIGCGYFNIETANKLQEHVGIVTGVKTFDDMLDAEIVALSDAAESVGIRKGMKGREALLKLT